MNTFEFIFPGVLTLRFDAELDSATKFPVQSEIKTERTNQLQGFNTDFDNNSELWLFNIT